MVQFADEDALPGFGFGEPRDIDKGRYHAFDLVIGVLVGIGFDQVNSRIPVADLPFPRFSAGKHRFDIILQCRQIEAAGEIGDRPTTIGGQDVENLAHGRREAADRQIAVEKHGGHLRALEQIMQIAVGEIERVDF